MNLTASLKALTGLIFRFLISLLDSKLALFPLCSTRIKAKSWVSPKTQLQAYPLKRTIS